jgi:hypothetical protein
MKAIRKRAAKKSSGLLTGLIIVLFLFAVSFILNMLISGEKNDVDGLTTDVSLPAPKSSLRPGFYKEPVSIELGASGKDTKIYYTTDGSEPGLGSTRYETPIIITDRTGERNKLSEISTSPRWKRPMGNVFKGTVIRAVCISTDKRKSKEMISTYFIRNSAYEIPVLAFSFNEQELFGYKKGIYMLGKRYDDKDNYVTDNVSLDLPWWEYPANYLIRGGASERKVNLEFFEKGGELAFDQQVGLRINGNATRGYAQKSLRVICREEYGQKEIAYDIFGSGGNTSFTSFILRNSGNDWDKTMFRDALMQSLMKNTAVDVQAHRLGLVFMNAEYWGIHNIQERIDEHYLAKLHGKDPSFITLLELDAELVTGKKSEAKEFRKLLDFVKSNDLGVKSNYDHVCSEIDVENFQDFVIANVFFCNSDWPNNNVKYWHSLRTADGAADTASRWRWILYDTDWGFGYNSSSTPENDLLKKAASVGVVGTLFGNLIQNEDFKSKFLQRFQLHLNSRFRPEEVTARIDSLEQATAPYIAEHIARWRSIESVQQWERNVDILRDFATRRPAIQAEQLNRFFNLEGQSRITVPSGGKKR